MTASLAIDSSRSGLTHIRESVIVCQVMSQVAPGRHLEQESLAKTAPREQSDCDRSLARGRLDDEPRQLATPSRLGSMPMTVVASSTPPESIDARVTDDVLLPLVKSALADDSRAVGELVQRIAPRMLRTVRQVMGSNHPDVEDITQDAVMGFLQALTDFRAESSVLHFAHRVALLTALAARRRLGTRERRFSAEGYEDRVTQDQSPSPHGDLLASRRRQLVRELLDDLPEVIAEAMAAHFILGMTVEEIAASANVPPNTVWSRLRLGKATMRKRLRRDQRLSELLGVFE